MGNFFQAAFGAFAMDFTEKRFEELASRAARRYCAVFTDFLNMEEQSALLKLRLETPFSLFGGYEGAERRVAAFGEDSQNASFPLAYIKIEPLSAKFADKLSHRDFLGSLMGLGIKRETLGDILISGSTAYLVCLEGVSEYIIQNLSSVKRTSVKCSAVSQLPQDIFSEPREERRIVASMRIDVLVAAVYNLSRSAVKELFLQRRVFVNSALCENFSLTPREGDIISVRGWGRFRLGETLGSTKKGRTVAQLFLYE